MKTTVTAPTPSARLTPKQRKVFDFVRSYTAEHGYAPSLQEICAHMGLSAVSTAHEHMRRLAAKGYLRRAEHVPRSAELVAAPIAPSVVLRLLGSVCAGLPTESYQIEETVAVPAHMVGRGLHYGLKVMGESMCDENITTGDILVVRHANRAVRGDLVIALVDGREVTVKRFYPERNHVRLQPSNKNLQPIRVPKSSVQIQGIVVGLLRNYEEAPRPRRIA